MKKLPLLLFALVVLGGCSPKATGPSAATSGTDPKLPVAQDPPKEPVASTEEVPTDLKHAAFDYYGLASGKDLTLEIRTSTKPEVYTGGQKAVLKSVKDGKATYTIERTGGLAEMLGKTQEIVVDKNGIFATSIEGAPIEPIQQELPADMSTGKTWASKSKFSLSGQEFQTDTNFRVVGPEKVTTKLGTFDAILVVNEGMNVVGGQKMQISAKAWYVKGMGEVKVVLTSKDTTGQTATVNVEATK